MTDPESEIPHLPDSKQLAHDLGATFTQGLNRYAALKEEQKLTSPRGLLESQLEDSAHAQLWMREESTGLFVPGPIFEDFAATKRLAATDENLDISQLSTDDVLKLIFNINLSLTENFVKILYSSQGQVALGMPVDNLLGRFEHTGSIETPGTKREDIARGLNITRTMQGPQGPVRIIPDSEIADLQLAIIPSNSKAHVTAEKLSAHIRPTGETITMQPLVKATFTEETGETTDIYRGREGTILVDDKGSVCFPHQVSMH
jgi:hypothetical protein